MSRENLRLLFLDFIDLGEDEEVWQRYLEIYDDLLAEVNNPLTCNRPIMACDKTISEVKRLRELLVEAAHCIHEMEGMAYADADPDDFAKHAMEFRGNVSETIGADAPWGVEE